MDRASRRKDDVMVEHAKIVRRCEPHPDLALGLMVRNMVGIACAGS